MVGIPANVKQFNSYTLNLSHKPANYNLQLFSLTLNKKHFTLLAPTYRLQNPLQKERF